MKRNYYFTGAKLLFIVLLPLVLLVLPKDFFDRGETICLSRILLDVECYACGMTRACMHLIHLDFEGAFAYNMLSFLVLPLLSVVWLQWFRKEWRVWMLLRSALPTKQL